MSALRMFSRNLPYLRQQSAALIGNTSPSVKFICLAVVSGYILSCFFSISDLQDIIVTPGLLIPPKFRLWSAFTFWFIEVHLYEVIVDIITVGLCGKLIEPLWGTLEMMKFFCVTNIGVAFLGSFFSFLLYAVTEDSFFLFEMHIRGLSGYLAGVAVAVKQILPDHLLVKTPLGKLTNRSIPLLILVLAFICYEIGFLDGIYSYMWLWGTIVSWIYLRFWQRHSNGMRGDTAENFSLDNFFPTVLQPVVRGILGPPYRLLVRLGVCTPTPRRVHLALSPSGVTISMPGVEPQDMERRRQIALKALSERLSKTSEQTRQKNATAKINMDTIRKAQTHVIPQFPPDQSQSSSSGPVIPPVTEATLVDLGAAGEAASTTKQS